MGHIIWQGPDGILSGLKFSSRVTGTVAWLTSDLQVSELDIHMSEDNVDTTVFLPSLSTITESKNRAQSPMDIDYFWEFATKRMTRCRPVGDVGTLGPTVPCALHCVAPLTRRADAVNVTDRRPSSSNHQRRPLLSCPSSLAKNTSVQHNPA